MALGFLEQGYHVTGLDLSPHMLAYARENTARFVAGGQATFIQGDAAQFALDQRFGLVLSTYDALNHLADFDALRSCFRSVHGALTPGGWFIFDLNTRRGLQRWNGTNVDDSPAALVITRGVFEAQAARAQLAVCGFLQTAEGLYERFDETIYNTVFDIQAVLWTLLDQGWAAAHAARFNDLPTALAEPEQEGRVFIVAQRGA